MGTTNNIPTIRIAVVLTADSSLHSSLLAIEPFRAANRLSRQSLFSIDFVTPDGNPVETTLQIVVRPTASFGSDRRYDLVLIATSYEPSSAFKEQLFPWLRRQARFGAHICGIDLGPLLLAECGLLKGYTATSHWTAIAAFRDHYPNVTVVEQLFVIDRGRSTCAGQVCILDYSLCMLERYAGKSLSEAVSNELVYMNARSGDGPQRRFVGEWHWKWNPTLSRASEIMNNALEDPLPIGIVASMCHVSLRELQYLFKRHLQRSPRDFYMELRLNRSRELLLYSCLNIREIGLACGFSAESTFFRAFRSRFNKTPQKFRESFNNAPISRDGRRVY
ncbi:GlxA family transcriptional regulator [Aquamicrobium defluvii]|uniref:HTH araC/xylS-type domain-containing protein n=1 Tax=Aquamicrobium defluvii TaxID=69279 RepID=A0A011U2G2_9HYPH|nr:helix-turn-helix domain-containing protein [Aquamicrobium defluvii]EXL10637.1 hypothetical protein BG36_01360 [Aquamicrobium defluvii]EZQ17819.1 hypothetical protein CF98_32980 [Halopseudomonas bauzanensis]